MTTARLARLTPPFIVALLLTACTSPATEPDAAPSADPPETTSAATPPPAAAGDVVTTDPAGALLAATREPLDSSTLLPGYHYEDTVEIDDGTEAVSNIYGGPDGPTGPTIWLHTNIGRDYATDRHVGLTWVPETDFPNGYVVRSAHGGDGYAFVDIDAQGEVDASVQLVARGVPIADLRGVALRITSTTDR